MRRIVRGMTLYIKRSDAQRTLWNDGLKIGREDFVLLRSARVKHEDDSIKKKVRG
jgi:hypothetical protein